MNRIRSLVTLALLAASLANGQAKYELQSSKEIARKEIGQSGGCNLGRNHHRHFSLRRSSPGDNHPCVPRNRSTHTQIRNTSRRGGYAINPENRLEPITMQNRDKVNKTTTFVTDHPLTATWVSTK